jgi:hypothetical protein
MLSLVFFGEKNLEKATSYFIRCCKYSFFQKALKKNHKLKFQETITTIIITSDYNFEETSEKMSLK